MSFVSDEPKKKHEKGASEPRTELQKRRGRDAFGGSSAVVILKEISEKSPQVRGSPNVIAGRAGEASDRLRRVGLLVVLILLLDVEPL